VEQTVFYSLAGPLEAVPTAGQIRAGDLQGFAEFVRRRGGDPRSILERYGIDPGTLVDPDSHIECKAFVEVFEYCGSRFDDPLFGLRLARLQEPDVLGCVVALCRAAPSFREALRCFIDYIPVAHSPGTTMELIEGDELAELRYKVMPGIGSHDQSSYHGVMLLIKLLRQIGGADFRPSYVSLTVAARSKDIAEIEATLRCRFLRGASNAVAFPARALDRPVVNSNRLLFKLLRGYLNQVKTAARTTIVERVEDYLRGSLPSGKCSIEHCARKLGIATRTLQLHLGEHEMRFSDILQRQRIRLAMTYLGQEGVSLDEVAYSLGYSEQSSFGRAFRRWTGSTPQSYRNAELQDEARRINRGADAPAYLARAARQTPPRPLLAAARHTHDVQPNVSRQKLQFLRHRSR
jgi:AraC-like DNA-binding protein